MEKARQLELEGKAKGDKARIAEEIKKQMLEGKWINYMTVVKIGSEGMGRLIDWYTASLSQHGSVLRYQDIPACNGEQDFNFRSMTIYGIQFEKLSQWNPHDTTQSRISQRGYCYALQSSQHHWWRTSASLARSIVAFFQLSASALSTIYA